MVIPYVAGMGSWMRRLLIISVLMALGACQLALPGKGTKDASAASGNPITGGDIAVTSLDAAGPAAPGAADLAPGAPKADVASDANAKAVTDTTPSTDAKSSPPATDAIAAADATPEVEAAPPAEVVVVRSPFQLACEKKGGRWSMAGSVKASFCQTPTRDAGKSCSKSKDCKGLCLSKSRTCAPYTPLFGCNDILDENGRMFTQCLN